jgi:hypothetical protein
MWPSGIKNMSEIIKHRVSESVGKAAKIFLHNGFRYAGKITNFDDKYVEIIDFKSGAYKIIEFCDIKDCEVEQ